MNNRNERELLVETGRELLEKNIVARTWGNTSCRVDDEHCLITPSGLDYMQTTEEDIVLLDLKSGEWEGRRKPSGERGVHIAAYRQFPGVNFVIHTHQNYATAIGLTGIDSLQITEEEKRQLGGLGAAAYGLPGMKKLTDAVDHVLQQGIQTVLMVHHGVLVCGRDKAQAMERVQLLEKICERNICAGYLQSSKQASAGAHKSGVAAKALEGFSAERISLCGGFSVAGSRRLSAAEKSRSRAGGRHGSDDRGQDPCSKGRVRCRAHDEKIQCSSRAGLRRCDSCRDGGRPPCHEAAGG